MSLGNAVLLAVVSTVLCLCIIDVSAMGLPAGRYALPEDEPTAKRRLSMIDMLRNPYESFDDVARQDWRTAVQGYFDVMNKIGKTKNNRSGVSPSQDSYIKRYT